MDSIDDEIKNEFLIEAKELLSNTEQSFLALEKCGADFDTVTRLFRLAHNLKGSAGAVGFNELADFTHKLESLLLAIQKGATAINGEIIDLLLQSNDYLTKSVDALTVNLKADYANPTLKSALERALTATPPSSPAADPEEVKQSETPQPADVIEAAPIHVPAAPAASKSKDENIRVSLSRIEQLLNNVGELSILQAIMVQQSSERSVQISPLMRETLSAMSKIIKETQSVSMSLRMIPLKQTFSKMERIVRDTSKALGKEVELHLEGTDTEIDKTVLEQLTDPLVHIVRNAIDHGLESPADRIIAGKSQTGQVYLSAYHRSGHVVIEVREDGRGLDAEKLIAIAKAKGVIGKEAVLSNEDAYQLIFAPGFSTKEVVTDVSGRGVGMDVVKTNIAAVQGHIEIETVLGAGTSFRIFLPLTLAIIDSVIVKSSDEKYVVPLSQISEFFRPEESDITSAFETSDILTLRGEPMAVFRLGSFLESHVGKSVPAWNLTALIVRDPGQEPFAVLVDKIVSLQQIVVKPMGGEMSHRSEIMGSAILGSGKPALILDLFELTRNTRTSQGNRKNRTVEAA